MKEFGEKIKQRREEKGMTQQTMAEHLYVTRQAVSRWECGARYPDLLMARKISQILETSIDELVSGEEFSQNRNQEPILKTPVTTMIQTILYTAAFMAYLFMSIFSAATFWPDSILAAAPVGKVEINIFIISTGYMLNLCAMFAGLYYSVKKSLTPGKTGIIMSMSYHIQMLTFIVLLLDSVGRNDIRIEAVIWLQPLAYAVCAACIIRFFGCKKKRIAAWPVYLVAIATLFKIISGFKMYALQGEELGFIVSIIQLAGKLGIVVLLCYQTYVLNRKRNHTELFCPR